MPRGKRQLSRKGCFSCKKLKIKCNEAKPQCEYCSHTGRDCVYPVTPIVPSTGSVYPNPRISALFPESKHEISSLDFPSIIFYDKSHERSEKSDENTNSGSLSPAYSTSSYEASIYGNPDEEKQTFERFMADHVLSPRPYNQMSTHLQMTRFELRLLRFFHDQCIPYVTFNANKKGDHIWRNVFPKYFASSDLVRQSTYAMACLNLWPVTNLPGLLQSDQQDCQFQILPLGTSSRKNPFSHVFNNLSVFENSSDSIFSVTTSYFITSLQASQSFVAGNRKELTYEDLATLYFSGFFIFAYVGVHPHCVLPLIDHNSDYPSDFIGFFSSMRRVFLTAPPGMREQVIDTLMEYSFLVPTAYSDKIGFVEVLRAQLKEYHFANTAFLEIGSEICDENEVLRKTLYLFECCYLSAVKEGHPTPFFKFLVLLDEDFIALARQHNFFALRILLTFSFICLYCQFYLSFHENVWVQYIDWFTEQHSPMCESDARLHKLVMVDHKFADPNKFSHEMKALNRMSFGFGDMDVPLAQR